MASSEQIVDDELTAVKVNTCTANDKDKLDKSLNAPQVSSQPNPDTVEDKEDKDGPEDDEEDKKDDGEVDSSSLGQGTSQTDIDPFAYLQRDEFTSEIFKIEINNLPRRFGIGQLRKRLLSLGLKPNKFKSVSMGNYAFVNFKCEEDRQDAIKKLEGHQWKGKKLKAKKANPSADPLLKKRKQEADLADSEPQRKVLKNDEEPEISPVERLNQAVSPLWEMPYEEQLKTKEGEIHGFLKKLGRQIQNNNQDLDMKDHLRAMFKAHKGLCCQVDTIKPSPVLNNYRNKCELTIGQSTEGVDKVVGFRLGRYKGGSVSVVEADECIIVPERMKECARSLQTFLQKESSLPGFDPETKAGNWKMALLRQNLRGDVLMAVVLHPQKLDNAFIQKERENLQRYYTDGEGQSAPLKSLYFLAQSDRKDQHEENCNDHLKGDLHIEEDLLDLRFQISPGAFFQVNTLAAAVLYETIGDWCSVRSDTVLLDICCGTGTIGLTLAKRVKKVVGIEMCKEAVEDARTNAKLNNVTNVEFYCSKAETILPSLIWRFCRENVVAVVDPPRAGLHPDVVRAIRKADFVQHLVYVSCKLSGALTNLVDFTRSESKRFRGIPFKLVQAVPVDLFPHTPHSELVMLFVRSAPERSQAAKPAPMEKPVGNSMETENGGEIEGKLEQETSSNKTEPKE